MNDQELGKKMVEEEAFRLFAHAYERATGDSLIIASRLERPDFICERTDGSRCGLELTEVRSDPDEIILQGPLMPPDQAADLVCSAVFVKDMKRQDGNWQFPDDTILVLQLMNCGLSELKRFLTDSVVEGAADCGFAEVWIADFTTIEPYGEVELFCILPEDLRGYYHCTNRYRKPFG